MSLMVDPYPHLSFSDYGTYKLQDSLPIPMNLSKPPFPGCGIEILNFELSDDEDEYWEPVRTRPNAQYVLGPRQRKIAGSRRVARLLETNPTPGSGPVLQSITAAPQLSHKSFEEMRVECYRQSALATGKRSEPVDPCRTMSSIPPVFHAFRSEKLDDDLLTPDVVMFK